MKGTNTGASSVMTLRILCSRCGEWVLDDPRHPLYLGAPYPHACDSGTRLRYEALQRMGPHVD